ncbi:MAG: hypothetical protein Q8K55_08345 [Gemmatimonadaceae bacterium]|nr:hypothetical protein [Gemmatimonadaceae bacterium]
MTGRILLVLAALLVVLGIVSWPPGGLMFALPYVFLMPGVVLAVVGGVLLWLGRRPGSSPVSPGEP